MQAVGISIWVEQESDLDAVTAISGSGPAYFFYFIELLEAAGVELGLPAETAALLARQTALGAATMAQGQNVVELRNQVTSRKGTTEQAILSFQHDRLDQLVLNATNAARRRSLELAHELTGD
jgi:pyrroline-5-carboxylate reductase